MGTIGSLLMSASAIGAFTLATLPAQAQYVSIPVSNGSFTIIGNAANQAVYSGPITLLSPIGTLNITSAALPWYGFTFAPNPTPIYIPTLAGTASLNDGRSASFTNAVGRFEGTWTLGGSGGASHPLAGFGLNQYGFTASTRVDTFQIFSGTVDIPQANVTGYSTPQFNIPISGGSFVINDAVGTSHANLTINAVLTPIGTANLTITAPILTNLSGAPEANVLAASQAFQLSGVANGSVALNGGGSVTVSDRLVTLEATAALTGGNPGGGGNYYFNMRPPATATTITGTLTGGSISVPESAVTLPSPPVQPQPIVTRPEPVVAPPAPQLDPQPRQQEFALGFATSLNLGGEPEEYLRVVELEPVSVAPVELPEVEQSPLTYSRIHPGVNAYNR
ncbi:MAG: hypothetical protein NW224_17355 [Leptolyngbyaceae cyanobacterium bins.302]|nr:hypothetical protein [Leptolyngbyaceae cyanobacterium bins.302]